ncbi:hypothetical protein GCM10022286_00560 [Gryllotalpicola daejeonensis]|uniref:LapA family protein n=1 Tax=Gryllotalpicola daejeonensis TaxID=993087 RepID=A0ABP7ZD03_9MICO
MVWASSAHSIDAVSPVTVWLIVAAFVAFFGGLVAAGLIQDRISDRRLAQKKAARAAARRPEVPAHKDWEGKL